MSATSPCVSTLPTSARTNCAPQPDQRLQIGARLVTVPEGKHLRLNDRNSHTVTAMRGTLWITQDGDVRDWILERGESMVFERATDILISAMSDATIRLDGLAEFGH